MVSATDGGGEIRLDLTDTTGISSVTGKDAGELNLAATAEGDEIYNLVTNGFPLTQVFGGADNEDGDNTFDNITSAVLNTLPNGTIEVTDAGTYTAEEVLGGGAFFLVDLSLIATNRATLEVNYTNLFGTTLIEGFNFTSGKSPFTMEGDIHVFRDCRFAIPASANTAAGFWVRIPDNQMLEVYFYDCYFSGWDRLLQANAAYGTDGNYLVHFERCEITGNGSKNQVFKFDQGRVQDLSLIFKDCYIHDQDMDSGSEIFAINNNSGETYLEITGTRIVDDIDFFGEYFDITGETSATLKFQDSQFINSAVKLMQCLELDNGSGINQLTLDISNCIFDGFDAAIDVAGDVAVNVNHSTFVGLDDQTIHNTFSSAFAGIGATFNVRNSAFLGIRAIGKDGGGTSSIDIQNSLLMPEQTVFEGSWASATTASVTQDVGAAPATVLEVLTNLTPLAPGRDYTVSGSDSAVYGLAVPWATLPVTTDILGEGRDTVAPDAGAHELNPNVVSIDRGGASSIQSDAPFLADFHVLFSMDVSGIDTTGPTYDNFTLVAGSGLDNPRITAITQDTTSSTLYLVTVAADDGQGEVQLNLTSTAGITPGAPKTDVPFASGVYEGDESYFFGTPPASVDANWILY